jgi:hypothetical protein
MRRGKRRSDSSANDLKKYRHSKRMGCLRLQPEAQKLIRVVLDKRFKRAEINRLM